MSSKMQVAAVLAALDEGKSLDEIERDHPELAEAVKQQREKQQQARPRGSGPTAPLPSPRSSFTI